MHIMYSIALHVEHRSIGEAVVCSSVALNPATVCQCPQHPHAQSAANGAAKDATVPELDHGKRIRMANQLYGNFEAH
jgi:hypothetical protein